MNYIEKTVKKIKEGGELTFLEKMALEHGNPVNCILSLVAFGFFSYGLWTQELIWIIPAAVLGFLGHVYCWIR